MYRLKMREVKLQKSQSYFTLILMVHTEQQVLVEKIFSFVGYRVLLNNKIIVASHVDTVQENLKCIGLDEVESKYPSPSTSTLQSSRGEENHCDDDFIDDNVFQNADEIDEQELKVANKDNFEKLKIPRRYTHRNQLKRYEMKRYQM